MSDQETVLVEVERGFRSPPEQVFDAFLEPALAGRFLFATPDGEMVRVEIDGRVGGRFVITERRAGEDVEHMGEYLDVDRPKRLAFTFSVPKYADTADQVSIDVVPNEGGCKVSLCHAMPAAYAEYTEQAREGWGKILDGLAAVLGEI
ncbi:MAG: SRPBCC domain-containing protein [Candidatus Hydrogenedens sp.]|nr:SRPBCC domain-containing protein [Candidatus Hydrogenedens sp.]